MATFMLTITEAGLDALVDAQNGATEAIVITALGLSAEAVTISPTLEALPGEFKRIGTISGESASETVIHLNALDASEDTYDVRSIGLFLADGTLFAAFTAPGGALIFRKVDIASFLFSVDIAFSEAVADDIQFGDTTFLYPPATESKKGVAEIATQPEVDAGADDERIITPLKLAHRLTALLTPILQDIANEITARGTADTSLQGLITALTARTISGAGLVTGGGNLSANRTLTVTAATLAQALAGSSSSVALTPASLGGFKSSFSQTDYMRLPGGLMLQWGRFTAPANSTTAVTFPIAFPNACFAVQASGTSITDVSSQENTPVTLTSSITATGFSAFASDNEANVATYIAVGY